MRNVPHKDPAPCQHVASLAFIGPSRVDVVVGKHLCFQQQTGLHQVWRLKEQYTRMDSPFVTDGQEGLWEADHSARKPL